MIKALGYTVATPLPSWALSHVGSAALGRLAAGVPAGIPRERSTEGCASAAVRGSTEGRNEAAEMEAGSK